jgi:hypothetical protein
VTITAAASAAPKQIVSATVTIRSAGRSGLLVGRYAFLLTGVDANGVYVATGSINLDGLGGVSGGEEDLIDTAGAHSAVSITGGSYTISDAGLGDLVLNTSDSTLGVSGVQTLSFAVVSTQHAQVIEFDDKTVSSGTLDLQSPNNFFQSSIAGGYSFVFSGIDLKSQASMRLGGVMAADGAGNFTVVTEDVNDGGTVAPPASASGTYAAPDSSGRGMAALGSSTFVYYVVSTQALQFVETDSGALTAGTALAQGTGPFGNSSLSGNFAFTASGRSTKGALVAGGLFTTDGNGNITSATVDVNNAGLVTNGTAAGTYAMASNGRGTLTLSSGKTGGLSQFALYLTSDPSSPILLLELDSGLTMNATARAQASGMSASTFKGNYAFNFSSSNASGLEDFVGQLSSDGVSVLTGSGDINQPGDAPTPGVSLAGSFVAASNGRFTGTLSIGSAARLNQVFYVLSSSTVLLAEMDAGNQATGLLQLQQFPSGPAISIAFAPGETPPAKMQAGTQATLGAIVTNDSTNAGVDWTVSCPSSSCGSFNPAHTASGATTTYTAPPSVPPGGSVTITVASTADPTRTVTAAVTITGVAAAISVTIAQPAMSPFPLLAGTSAQVIATVSNDPTNSGVSWTLSCPGSVCGSVNPTKTPSGSATTYTAPTTPPPGGTVNITAASVADYTKTATATATITTSAPSGVTINFCGPAEPACTQPSPPTALLTSQQALVAADVQNDPTNSGVDWTCQPVSDCGSFNPNHTASDAQTTFTAPASTPTGGTVTITATATADPTQSVSQPVTITSAGSTPLLKGQYAFFFTGLDSNGFAVAAGSITADGFGNITTGEEDFYDPTTQEPQVGLTGTYSIAPDGIGTMTLTPNGIIGVCNPNCVQTLSFVVVSPQHALIIAFDTSATSSGSLDLQNSSNFSLGSVSGGYSFIFSGIDLKSSAALARGGILTADGKGNFTSVTEDVNDGGTVTAGVSAAGTYNCGGPPDSFGRGTAAFGSCTTGTTFVYYIVSSGTLRFIETDPKGFTAGTAFAQGAGPFSNASLSGAFTFTLSGKSATGPLVAGGLVTSGGNGNITSGTLDINNAGSVTNGTPSGNYSLASNGRGTLTLSKTGGLSQFGIYLTSNPSNPILLLELDSGLTTSGAALAQTSGISASTFSGDYAVRFDAAIASGEEDLAGEAFSDGVSALGGNANINQFVTSSSTQTPNTALAIAFIAASNGRFTGSLSTLPTGNLNKIFYVASNSTILFIETDSSGSGSGPATGVLQLQQFPQQFAIPIFAAFSPLPPTSLQTGAQGVLTALVANDATSAGVDWTVTCQGSTCGSFSPAHTASGAPTTFTAPPSIPTGKTVSITAVSHADSTKTVTATVAVGGSVSIAFTSGQAPPSTMQIDAIVAVSATVANDSKNLGVDWTSTCPDSDCGSFTPTHTASGVATMYTAPASVPSSGSVTLTATATANPAATATATVAITGPPPSITIIEQPPSSMQTGTTATISADVQNDPKNLGVNWTVTCGSGNCGSFNPTHTASDAETVYTAPTSVPASGSVTIIATAAADSAATATQQVTITAVGPETGLLKGQYAFSVTGLDDNAVFYVIVGSITADGNGNITTGEEDFYDLTISAPLFVQGLTGTYTIGADGRGTITLNTGESSIGESGVQTFSVAVISSERALITQFDSSASSSGSLDQQNSSDFALSSVSNGYSFIFSGLDTSKFPATAPLNFGGVLTADAKGHFNKVTEDLNDGGTVAQDVSTSGTYNCGGAPDSSGRGTAAFGSCATGSTFVYYIVNSGVLRFLESDLNGLTAGSLFAQGSGLSDASISGSFAFTLAGKNSADGALAIGGLLGASGSGTITGASVDVNNAGSVSSGTPTGSYTVGANGRGSLTFTSATGGVSQLGLYLTPILPGLASGQMGALLLDLDSGLTASGIALTQASDISASTFSGNYSGNFQAVIQSGEQDAAGQVVSNGASDLTGNADVNQLVATKSGVTSTQTPDDALSGTFTAASDGRFTGTLHSSATGTLNEIFYVVNSSTVLFVDADTIAATSGPGTGLLQLQQFKSTADLQPRSRRARRVVSKPVTARRQRATAPVGAGLPEKP